MKEVTKSSIKVASKIAYDFLVNDGWAVIQLQGGEIEYDDSNANFDEYVALLHAKTNLIALVSRTHILLVVNEPGSKSVSMSMKDFDMFKGLLNGIKGEYK